MERQKLYHRIYRFYHEVCAVLCYLWLKICGYITYGDVNILVEN